ncbi:DUF5709 domain-containing protein [Luteimicrobium subarcticum]|uniref:DUF5709 domain-containing protein n=1 Tax=Luteimicrobium subarcticum TaxID=620910 RepID=A0A2M8WVD9_9MICO|nr:DUF5709 domain-containing protein [Luteimicrobium subarcticum]PJI94891.1 hypothetical protein CLV34_0739 [Luteimicrobium subarcticum]
MSQDTTGTSPEPEYTAEGDNDQLDAQDTLVDRGVDDPLDEGYVVPERDRKNHWGETAYEEASGEPLDLRLSEEEPDTTLEDDDEEDEEEGVDTTRAGRLAEDPDAIGRGNDVFATDEGISGAAASAEEAAVHVVDDET